MLENNNEKLINEVIAIVDEVKDDLPKKNCAATLYAYWNIGKIIISNEIKKNMCLDSGTNILDILSDELTKNFGRGFSKTNLKYMRMFYKAYPNYKKVNETLSWTHYIELMAIKNIAKRRFYEKKCVKLDWSVRELQEQLATSLYEKSLLKKSDKKLLECNEK